MLDGRRTNELGQPVGLAVEGWGGARPPVHETVEGERCRLEPLEAARHAEALYEAFEADRDGADWTYLPYGPFACAADYVACVRGFEALEHTHFYAIVDRTSARPLGVASYLRFDPANGSIEVGHLRHAPSLQRTPMSTEAMYLLMRRVFEDWGYRRYEWKCDALNAPSRAAARRLGFRFEGLFRQHAVVKGRSRDTAWLSITDAEWPGIRSALESWLSPGNFDDRGRQRTRLAEHMPAHAGAPIVEEIADRGLGQA
jgi:RimJ/RimL family protein N-acetyltransferase